MKTAAACLKGFYLRLGTLGVNPALAEALRVTRLPTRADRRRAMLGHVLHSMPANPLAPGERVRRHPKMVPEGARDLLLGAVSCARDRMVVTWLADGGFRIGELCGLRLVDLHLREQAACGQCRGPHVHICHREDNANRARVKTKTPWESQDGTVCGGTVRRVSPAMIHTYFEYITTQYPARTAHGMLLVSLHGSSRARAVDHRRGPRHAASALALEPRGEVLHLHRLRLYEEQAFLVEDIWLPLPLFEPLEHIGTDDLGDLLYPTFERACGQIVAAATEELTVDAASADDALLLGCARQEPVVVVERVARSHDGTPLEYRRSRGLARTFRYRIDLR